MFKHYKALITPEKLLWGGIAGSAILLLYASFIAGSGIKLCTQDAPEGLNHEPGLVNVFKGAAGKHNRLCVINAYNLEPGEKYRFKNGLLIIEGDVPPETKITVSDGKIYVEGNIGPDAKITARAPEDFTSYPATRLTIDMEDNPVTETYIETEFEKFTYDQDPDPALMISGFVEQGARLSSNYGIAIGDHAEDVKFHHARNGQKTYMDQHKDFFITPILKPQY